MSDQAKRDAAPARTATPETEQSVFAGLGPWLTAGALGLVALVGLFILSRAESGPNETFGALMALAGIGGIFWMVGKATRHD